MMSRAPAVRWRHLLSGENQIQLAGLAGVSVLAAFFATAPLSWAAVALGVSCATLIIAVRPALGLVALAWLIPVGSLAPFPLSGANGVDLLVAAVAIGWLARGMAMRKVMLWRTPLLWPLLILIWLAALSLLQAHSWREGAPELLKWAEFFIVYFVAAQTLDSRQRWWVVVALLAAGLCQVALGAYQFARQVGPPAFILAGRFMRAYGTFQQPNPYAGYLGYLAPVAASLAIEGFGGWRHERRPRHLIIGLLCAAVTVALSAGIGMSWSRGGWLALAAAFIAVAALRNQRMALLTLMAGLLLTIVVLVAGTGWLPAVIAGRLNDLDNYFVIPDPAQTEITDENFAVLERLAHWRAGLRMFDDRPWLGVGIGNYGDAYADYALPHWYEPLGHAHNIYVNFLAETGILGALAFLAFWIGALRLAWITAGRTQNYTAALAIGIMGTLVYVSTHNFFDNLFVQHMQLQLALLLGCIAGIGQNQRIQYGKS